MGLMTSSQAISKHAKGGRVNTPATKSIKRFTAFNVDIALSLPTTTDPIQRIIRENGVFYEQQMLAELSALLPESPCIVDVGAGIGNYSLFFALIAGARTLCFEADLQVFSTLEQNIALNDMATQIEPHEVSLGAEPAAGTGEIGATLDTCLADQHVDLIRLAPSGTEADVLRGATAVLERSHPMVAVQPASLDALAEIEALLRPFGYRKTRRYGDAPVFLFEKGLKASAGQGSYSQKILESVKDNLPQTTGIYAGLSTTPGNETALRASVMSLLPQVDGLFIYLAGYSEAPNFLNKFDKIKYTVSKETANFSEVGRFWGLGQVEDAVFVTCSDDIIYPTDFTARMVAELAQTKGMGMVCVEGTLLVQATGDAQSQPASSSFALERQLIRRRRVHIPATTACAFHTKTVPASFAECDPGLPADAQIATYAETHNISRYVITRPAAWLQTLKTERRTAGKTDKGALKTIPPLSLASSEDRVPTIVLSLEKDDNIISALSALKPKVRDLALCIVCDAATDRLKTLVSQHQCKWEIHLLERKSPLSEFYQKLLEENAERTTYLEVRGRGLEPLTLDDGPREWIDATFQKNEHS